MPADAARSIVFQTWGYMRLALAAGDDLRVVQGLLGHASIVVTADIYASVLPKLYHDSARKTARLVLVAARQTPRAAKGARAIPM
ncbi:hypothetical protein Acor_65370 [Acrocarpospora corrugata]|uniref:Tyr recombinase domain-containing protein n=1 Tax=Acrocarpospora corrugata TaxID=35763 RepID=A0A5M3W7Z5_9ACTN|nr:hypothetical protein Acor_65370 [Acrocarpospora corrugata]